MTSTRHVPALDSLRGAAVILVVLSHAYPDHWVMAGPAGVAVFFVLSGYLITSLLVAELDQTGRLQLGRFYWRRAVRLLPALLLFLAVAALIDRTVQPGFAPTRDLVGSALYVENFVRIGGPHTAVRHVWSLSIEEQFYLVFPFVLLAVGRRARWRVLLAVSVAGAALSVGWRILLLVRGATVDEVSYPTQTNAAFLLLGCALAVWIHVRGHDPKSRPTTALLVLGAVAWLGTAQNTVGMRAVVPVAAAVLATVVVACVASGAPGWLSPGWLVLVGRRSYALYLWHYPILWTVQPNLPAGWWTAPLLIGVSWLLTLTSWHFVEAPCQRLRERISAVADPSPSRSASAIRANAVG